MGARQYGGYKGALPATWLLLHVCVCVRIVPRLNTYTHILASCYCRRCLTLWLETEEQFTLRLKTEKLLLLTEARLKTALPVQVEVKGCIIDHSRWTCACTITYMHIGTVVTSLSD